MSEAPSGIELPAAGKSMPVLKGEREKSLVGHGTWVGMEWSEGCVHEAGNPAGESPGVKASHWP